MGVQWCLSLSCFHVSEENEQYTFYVFHQYLTKYVKYYKKSVSQVGTKMQYYYTKQFTLYFVNKTTALTISEPENGKIQLISSFFVILYNIELAILMCVCSKDCECFVVYDNVVISWFKAIGHFRFRTKKKFTDLQITCRFYRR